MGHRNCLHSRLFPQRAFSLLTAVALLLLSSIAHGQTASPDSLVKDVSYNEVQDRARQTCWLYRVQHTADGHTRSAIQVESADGPVFRLLAIDGQPLSADQLRQEDARLAHLLRNPDEERKVAQSHQQDEDRLQRLTALLPQAFLYTGDGRNGNIVHLKFVPNPAFHPPTLEARAFAGLAGTLDIDAIQKRLVRLDGRLIHPIDFGFGLLGRIEQGGTFTIEREAVSATHWKTSRVGIHVSGHIVLFKSISRQQDEARSDFRPLPENTTLKDAVDLLDQQGSPAGSQNTEP
jgi:hypothetical protein